MVAQNFPLEPMSSVFSGALPSPRQSHPPFRLRRAGLPLLAMIRTSTWSYLGTGHGTSLGRRERCGSQERGCALSFHCRRVLASSQRAFALIAVERCKYIRCASVTGSTIFRYQTPSYHGDKLSPNRPSL